MKPKSAISKIVFSILLSFSFFLIQAQPLNDLCAEATSITVPFENGYGCFNGTLTGAMPDPELAACGVNPGPTVWYTFSTDEAAILNVNFQSESILNPLIRVFTGDCNGLQGVDVGLPYGTCIEGYQYSAKALNINLVSHATIFIAVSCDQCDGGDFQLCLATFDQFEPCVADKGIHVVSRSLGTDLGGPYFPGETVQFCFDVNSFSASQNGCQWFQGLIPVFGDGWDEGSFSPNGEPLFSTLNGNSIGEPGNGLYGTATWDWFTDVDYHYDSPALQIGDFDHNGTVEFCNTHFMMDCMDIGGVQGGCCGPCWGAPLGTILPPGWFAYGINGSCPTPGPPVRVDWGDGNTCGSGMGPWHFCFDLTVKELSAGDTTHSLDLSLGFMTTADGETGSWTGSASICAEDSPMKVYFTGCTDPLNSYPVTIPDICGDTSISFLLDQDGATYWRYSLIASNPIFSQSGTVVNGDSLHLSIFASGQLNYKASLHITALNEYHCPLATMNGDFNVITPGPVNQSYVQDTLCKESLVQYIPNVPGIEEWHYDWQLTESALAGEGTIANGATFALTLPDEIPVQHSLLVNFNGEDEAGCGQTSLHIEFPFFDIDPVIAAFDYTLPENTFVSFQNLSAGGLFFNWNFGDGVMSTGKNPFHLYDTSGVYQVTLIARGRCTSDTLTQEVSYFGAPPIADFKVQEPSFPCVPSVMNFENHSLYGTSYQWYFEGGDPESISELMGSSYYDHAGVFDVRLIAFNAFGSDTLFQPDFIEILDIPQAGYNVTQENGEVHFHYTGNPSDQVEWNINNGAYNLTGTDPIITLIEGTFEVVVTAINMCGGDQLHFQLLVDPSAINDPNLKDRYSLFPNPTSSSFLLHSSNPDSRGGKVSFYTPVSQFIAQLPWTDERQDLYVPFSLLAGYNGLILVRVESDRKTYLLKLVSQ